jgi:diaminopimelate epimerase
MKSAKNCKIRGPLLSGAGNSFAIEITEASLGGDEAREICHKFSVDGYLGLKLSGPSEVTWNFFNSDGSPAEFCGNAARCAQKLLNERLGPNPVKHQTEAGFVRSWTENWRNWVEMPTPEIAQKMKTIWIGETSWAGFFCRTGVPHFVLPKAKLSQAAWLDLSRELRKRPEFGAKGTNVTWINPETRPLLAVTYERGVEDFTQSCGTGALAAAFWWKQVDSDRTEFEIQMPGGLLQIKKSEKSWIMTGPVESIGEWGGEWGEI